MDANRSAEMSRAVLAALRDHGAHRGAYYSGPETALYLRTRASLREYEARQDEK